MSNDSTIPSQLGPIDTMPSSLGASARDLRPGRTQTSRSRPGVVLVAVLGLVIVYLVSLATGA
jgi:hypothetical protein